MFTIIQQLNFKGFLKRELPAFSISWVLAELFYKFGSFTLECAAFLSTWYIFGYLFNYLAPASKKS